MSRQNDMKARYAELKLTQDQIDEVEEAFARADQAQKQFECWSQEAIDRTIQSVAQNVSNSKNFHELVELGIQESHFGDPISREAKRFKIRGILRDCLRQKSVGIIEEIPEKRIVKYAKPVGVIACMIPATNPDLTPAGNAIYSIKARNAIIFSPHPLTVKTSRSTVDLMRAGLRRVGAPEDLVQILGYKGKPNWGLSQALMTRCDLVIATGGQDVVRYAYVSGTPAYAVGAGNATMIWDESAAQDLKKAAFNTMRSKTSDFGSGCSADGNILIHESIWDAALKELVDAGGYIMSEAEQDALRKVMWDAEGHRLRSTVALSAQAMAKAAGWELSGDRKFLIASHGTGVYNSSPDGIWCVEKLTTVLAVHKYVGDFQNAIDAVNKIHDVGGIGHSVGIFSFNDENIHRLASVARVGRITVRQPQSKANAGSMMNGMPMTSSIGCGTWGGNASAENIHLKHYMNVTWVSREYDKADWMTDQELFGEFYDPELEKVQYSPF